jgi:hypothetical protein
VGNKTFVTTIDKCLFLSPKFRNSSENGQIAYKSMLALYKGEYILMDMPTHIYKSRILGRLYSGYVCKTNGKVKQTPDFHDVLA